LGYGGQISSSQFGRNDAEAIVISVTTGELDDIPETARRLRKLS
jgi:hypothetical protein